MVGHYAGSYSVRNTFSRGSADNGTEMDPSETEEEEEVLAAEPGRTQFYLQQGMRVGPFAALIWRTIKELAVRDSSMVSRTVDSPVSAPVNDLSGSREHAILTNRAHPASLLFPLDKKNIYEYLDEPMALSEQAVPPKALSEQQTTTHVAIPLEGVAIPLEKSEAPPTALSVRPASPRDLQRAASSSALERAASVALSERTISSVVIAIAQDQLQAVAMTTAPAGRSQYEPLGPMFEE